jgi:hypothetical protein
MDLNLDCLNAWQYNTKPTAEMDVGLQQLLDEFARHTQQIVSVLSRKSTTTSSECCKVIGSQETQKPLHVMQITQGRNENKHKTVKTELKTAKTELKMATTEPKTLKTHKPLYKQKSQGVPAKTSTRTSTSAARATPRYMRATASSVMRNQEADQMLAKIKDRVQNAPLRWKI